MRLQRKRLGDILVEAGRITQEQLSNALSKQAAEKKRIGEVLLELGLISETEMLNILSEQLGMPIFDFSRLYISPTVARCIPIEVAKKYCLIPVKLENNELYVAMSDPLNLVAIDDVAYITRKKVKPYIASAKEINKAIDIYYSEQTTEKAIEDLKKEYNIEIDDKLDPEVLDEVQSAPAVRLTNSIIAQAINLKASDIHIEPFENQVVVRMRIDGVLSESAKIPLNLYSAVSTRIKIMAGMNIAEKRIPQDGRIETDFSGKPYDLRVSSLPTVFGEKIVIRVLDRSSFMFKREMLGFTEQENEIVDKLVKTPYGIILLTGPTGSGKTTTLYSILNELNTPDRNIVTVEDPVEYMLSGINQVQVNVKAGLTFAAGLRSILRQDPDVIMVGEIRDEETARIAVRAAITGHLVLSTLHTNDAPGAVTRLVDMGVEPYLVADAVVGVIAQRLVRRLCKDCRKQSQMDEVQADLLRAEPGDIFYMPTGCPACNNTGYRGRTAIHEVMMLDKDLRLVVEKGGNVEQLRDMAVKKGMATLFESCRRLVLKGETSIYEMYRTVYSRD